MTALLARARVIATAAVTWIQIAAAVVVILADEIGKAFPDDASTIAAWSARVLAVLGAALAIIRRVTPVAKSDRGLL